MTEYAGFWDNSGLFFGLIAVSIMIWLFGKLSKTLNRLDRRRKDELYLRKLRSPKNIRRLINDLETGDAAAARSAAIDLGIARDMSAISALKQAVHKRRFDVVELQGSKLAYTAVAAVGALNQIGGNEAIEFLRTLVSDGHDKIRRAAVEALTRRGFEIAPYKIEKLSYTGYVSNDGRVIELAGNVVPTCPSEGEWASVELGITEDKQGHLLFDECKITDTATGKPASLNDAQRRAFSAYVTGSDWRYHWRRAADGVKTRFDAR